MSASSTSQKPFVISRDFDAPREFVFNAGDEESAGFDQGRNSMKMGWTGTLDQLDAYLAIL